MQRFVRRWWLVAILALGALGGCAAEPEDPASDLLMGEDLLVAIPRELDGDAAARRQETVARFAAGGKLRGGPSRTFYLAVRRSALEQRWFWSVYLKELQPYGPSPGTLGTKVVRFREQNGKLYVFDADDRRVTSDVFTPDLIIDAFPIVDRHHFHSLPGSGGYLLIDPAAGTNRFGALADWFATDPYPVPLATELSFVEDFRSAPDGGHYEQIITAYADEPVGLPGDVDGNELRMAATLGHSLRRYRETPAYVPVPAPAVTHYFLGEPFNVPGTGEVAQHAVHWGFHPGMQPVKWVIGREILDLQADPELGGPDLFDAMKRGIESWNAVFGYRVFTAELASPHDSFADDRVNYLIVDPDVSKGYAYADWRTNPNTGEIRGASVYFGGGFFEPMPDDPEAAPDALAEPRPKTKLPMLVWQGRAAEPLCVRWAPAWEPRQRPAAGHPALTGAQKLERYILHITAHEVGHTLGLRHNFKGSLVPPTSSVMEYNLLDAAIAQQAPGPYDVQAIQYLHGQAPGLPVLPFCTDEDTTRDPECVRFDPATPDPLNDYHIPDYALYTGLLLEGWFPPSLAELIVSLFGTELLGFARAGTAAQATAAWQAALAGARAPLDPADLANNPALGPAADALSAAVFREILVTTRAAIKTKLSRPAVIAAIAADGEAILANLDGVRSYSTRRLVVDALKRAQTLDAYLALLDARAARSGRPREQPVPRAGGGRALGRGVPRDPDRSAGGDHDAVQRPRGDRVDRGGRRGHPREPGRRPQLPDAPGRGRRAQARADARRVPRARRGAGPDRGAAPRPARARSGADAGPPGAPRRGDLAVLRVAKVGYSAAWRHTATRSPWPLTRKRLTAAVGRWPLTASRWPLTAGR